MVVGLHEILYILSLHRLSLSFHLSSDSWATLMYRRRIVDGLGRRCSAQPGFDFTGAYKLQKHSRVSRSGSDFVRFASHPSGGDAKCALARWESNDLFVVVVVVEPSVHVKQALPNSWPLLL